jgi:hypothetical protein
MADDSARPEEAAPGFLGILGDLYFAPSAAFAAVLKRPAFWAPLLLVLGLNAGFTAMWLKKVDAEAFMKARIEESGRMDRIAADQRAGIIEQQARFLPVMAGLGPLFAVIFLLVIAGALTFVFRFFYAGEVAFRQGFAVTSWTSAAVGLVSLPLTLLILFLKDDWTLNPQEVLQANPSLLVERGDVAGPLFALLSSLDLFSFWMIALLALGFGLACRARISSALWGVLVPWAVYVLGKVGLSAIFG